MPKNPRGSTASEGEGAAANVEPAFSVSALLDKTPDGILVRTGDVYSYPGAPIDRSTLNIRLPTEYVTADQVREAIDNEEVRVAAASADGKPMTVVRATDENAELLPVSVFSVGTAYAGTEPTGGRPEHDAGMKDPLPPEEVEASKEAGRRADRRTRGETPREDA